MRGKGLRAGITARGQGITPACAGKSQTLLYLPGLPRDHPRVCGEKYCVFHGFPLLRGSPPRVRGKVVDVGRKSPARGITPAHAGKRPFRLHMRSIPWDHPRACGEKTGTRRTKRCHTGSPPRMRGKESSRSGNHGLRRITPAHAGKSSGAEILFRPSGDHPRACGEKEKLRDAYALLIGSPPRVRGKAVAHRDDAGDDGITPACAGKRYHRRRHLRENWDHPRVCREKLPYLPSGFRGWGSPPRVRGKDGETTIFLATHRITPARAGKSQAD